MMMSPKTWIAAVAVIASAVAVPVARADGKNEVRAVTFDEDGGNGITRVHVRGAQTPTFTVYKLERPSRVVIDLPQAKLADVLKGHESGAMFTPSTWAVSSIAAQQLDDGAVRVIVTLARPGRYDVKTDGNEVIVMVMPRDPEPKTASPAELARVQAESDEAKQQVKTAEAARAMAQQQADAASATAKQNRAEADAAKADADRLRKMAADQATKAATAQRAVEAAKQLSAQDLEHAKAVAAQARLDAEAAKTASVRAQAEAERTRLAADQSRKDAIAEADRAKAEAAKARDEMQRNQAEAQQTIAKTRAEADQAKTDAARTRVEADQAKTDAAKTRAEADQAKTDAAKTIAQTRAEAELAMIDAAIAMAAAQNDAARARQALADASRTQTELKQQAAVEVEAAKAEAARARADAELARTTAADDKRKAELARRDAEKLLSDAKVQLATLDKKSASAQQLEDKARAANAAAEAREEAARETVARAQTERAAAEAAAKQAQEARDRAAATDRTALAAEARAAAERLAAAKHATDEAEQQRLAAVAAAETAKRELEHTKVALSGVEQQRTVAVAAASDAARKRSEAEAAAMDASRRRTEAETARKEAELAATDAAQRKGRAEHDRAEAEAQRSAAIAAARTADKQRTVAETAAQSAVAAKHDAEASLAELTTRRQAAERAAAELETRSKAEAKAQADVIATQTRKASDRDIAAARAELARLGDERKRAETELADRRKAVAMQQAEAGKLETAAAQARDAATREETRRAKLADQRARDEAELAKLDAKTQQAHTDATNAASAAKQAQLDAANAANAAAAAKHAQLDAANAAKLEAKQVQAQVAETNKKAQVVDPKVKKDDAKNTKIAAITFKGDDGNGQVEIAVGADADVQIGEVTSSHVELIVDHAEIATKLERTLDVSKFGSPVKSVSSFRDRKTPNRVRLVAELAQPATPTVERDGNDVRWHFISADIAKRPIKVTNVPSPVVGGFGAASTPLTQQSVTQVPPQGNRRRIYHGSTVDFDFKDAPIHDLLRVIADTGHVNIVVPDTVDAKVTVRLKRVPWDQALEVILASHSLWYRREGNLYRIAPRKELDAEDAAEEARREASIKAEQPRPEVVTLNYASAEELKGKLENMKSPKGTIEVDRRTNSLIVNDVAGNRAEIIRLALSLDTQTPEISIEARIVEANSTFTREFGVQWGGNAIAGAAAGNSTGLIFPSTVAVQGANEDQQTKSFGVATPSDFAVNLPAAVGTGEGGALGLSLGSIGGNFNVNLKLSALEDSGTVRIISAPKVTVLNNKEAKISQGVSIPISVVSAAGTNTQFVQADLSLTVTPYVSQRDCAIAMNLGVTKNAPDFSNTGARGDPTIQRKEARTSMLVADGETAVLGGIYTRNASVAYKKIPFLGDLPVLGWLFKNRREEDDRTEILVFITPKITNKASLRCTQ